MDYGLRTDLDHDALSKLPRSTGARVSVADEARSPETETASRSNLLCLYVSTYYVDWRGQQ